MAIADKMAALQGVSFMMSSEYGDADEIPGPEMSLNGFLIGKHLVT